MHDKRPEFHLTKIDDSGTSSSLAVFALHQLPSDTHFNRRDFCGLGTSLATALAMLGSATATAAQPGPEAAKGSVVFAHTDAITALAFTPDGKGLVSSSRDGLVKTWDMDKGVVLLRLEDHADAVNDMAISGDGTLLVTASKDKTVRLWSLPKGELLAVWKSDEGEVNSVAFGNDAKTVAQGTGQGKVSLQKIDSATPFALIVTDSSATTEVACSPKYAHFASGGTGRLIEFWSLTDGQKKGDTGGHTMPLITALAFSPDGQTLAAASADKQITLRKVADRHKIQTLSEHVGAVHDLAFSPDGKLLASASSDCTVKLWQLPLGRMTESLQGPFRFTSVAISPDGAVLAAGDVKGVITLWDLVGRRLIGFLFDAQESAVDGGTFTVTVNQRTITYTLPCGSPIPAGATCTCNCVPGTLKHLVVDKVVPRPEVKVDVKVTKTPSSTTETLEARKQALAALREKRLQRQAEIAAAQREAAIRYYYYMRQYYAPSSGSSTRTVCTCIPVYR